MGEKKRQKQKPLKEKALVSDFFKLSVLNEGLGLSFQKTKKKINKQTQERDSKLLAQIRSETSLNQLSSTLKPQTGVGGLKNSSFGRQHQERKNFGRQHQERKKLVVQRALNKRLRFFFPGSFSYLVLKHLVDLVIVSALLGVEVFLLKLFFKGDDHFFLNLFLEKLNFASFTWFTFLEIVSFLYISYFLYYLLFLFFMGQSLSSALLTKMQKNTHSKKT